VQVLFTWEDDSNAFHSSKVRGQVTCWDLYIPMSSIAKGGFQYFITFTNDFSRYGYVYLMRHKSESFEKF
jgi:hypothetical protein